MSISVVVVTYRRLAHLEEILKAWLVETPDVWLCDCSRDGFKTTLPIHLIRATPDPGNRIRHAVALLTYGDLVIKADDDILPLPGLAADFERAWLKNGDAIYGVHGRRFLGPSYYRSTQMIGPGQIKRDIEPVDFVGVITAAPRKYLPLDLLGCASEVEDLFWQMVWFPSALKFVIKTANIKHLSESFDAGRLCADKRSRSIREIFYQIWYRKNYEKR
jgi:hypothetical protein